MWCVRTRDGLLRSAVTSDGIVVWSMRAWLQTDPEAAVQFAEDVEREQERRQRAFIHATGLGQGDKLAASMREAHRRNTGGAHVKATHQSRT